ncbi:MAG TPA: ABC transporter substrate-binding protein, partial [Paenibacillus sp.]|nr:ABC transporter substrate-binding protein [Paenibacillus sp.]
MNRKFAAALLTAVMLVGSIAAGCANQEENPAGAPPDTAEPTKQEPITFSWLAYDRVEGKVRQDWEIFKEIQAKTGVSVDFQVVSQEGLVEKRQIMIATNSTTDFIEVETLQGRQHGPENVFLNLSDYLDSAPNLAKFFETYPEAKAVATGADGG